MILLPAIDLYEKKAVRLYKGEYSKMTVYSEDPPKLAQEFREAGAEWLHMVDLEGARCGGTPNFDIAAKIIRTSGLAVELGGGIRDEETILRYLDAGNGALTAAVISEKGDSCRGVLTSVTAEERRFTVTAADGKAHAFAFLAGGRVSVPGLDQAELRDAQPGAHVLVSFLQVATGTPVATSLTIDPPPPPARKRR